MDALSIKKFIKKITEMWSMYTTFRERLLPSVIFPETNHGYGSEETRPRY